MSFLTEWIMNIVVFILLAMIVDMLLPNSNMKKYTKMVTGLLLIAIIITPLIKVFSKDFDQVLTSFSSEKTVDNKKLENLIESKKKEIQAVQDEYTLEQVAVQMKNDVKEELMDQYGKQIQNINLEESGQKNDGKNPIDKVIVYLEEAKENSIAAIEPIEIQADQPKNDKHLKEMESIKETLADQWNVTKDQIELHYEGRVRNLNEQ
ncbi:stage III sporulation protein AF [Heyndrickxia oleronia]|uniref:stage III sporulation protein AF n=1 Tax=Heyndrickxia oleronia TaxID=38875 RepID=UPI001B198C4D|nr:stage III sporulation protein AF [Heyndrickxia oleronia]GIN38332.1 stage III sporulation protein AF [Heyndrickxia oleronia]